MAPYKDPYEAVMSMNDSFVNPQDAERDMFMPGGFQNEKLRLESEKVKADENAMNYLRQTLNNSPTITPNQGLAAAILAAVPVLGGALISRSIGPVQIPEGVYGVDNLKPQGMGAAVGAAEAGGKAAQGYLQSLDRTDEQNKSLFAMAEAENEQARRLDAAINNVTTQGLAAQERDQAREDQQQHDIKMEGMRVAGNRSDEDYRIQKEIEKERLLQKEGLGRYSIEDRRREFAAAINADPLAKNALDTITSGGKPTPEGLAALSAIPGGPEAISRAQLGASRAAGALGERIQPPSQATKEAMGGVLMARSVGSRYINKLEQIGKSDPSYFERNIEVALPATELGQLAKDLELYSVQIRNAREKGVMTESDFQRYNSYLQIGKLDTIGSVLGRMRELQKITDLSAKATLQAAKAGKENVSGFEELLGISGDPDGRGSYGSQPDAATSPNTKVIGGVVYEKVPGGWKRK